MPSESSRPPTKIGGGKYELEKKLGAGCFGEVWKGRDTATSEPIAVKFEDLSGHALQLEHEVEILKILAQPTPAQGFTKCFHCGHEGRFCCMVMDLLGRSLEERLSGCGGKFTVPTTLLIADQVLRRIEYLHSKGIIHRDIKPENFMFGVQDKIHHLYLIDFGLSKRYYDKKHTQLRQKLSLTGTARYASLNAHRGVEQSRRDDLEAIGHMLVYFLRGALPWSGLEAKSKQEKYRKIKEKKESTKLSDLCEGYPEAFESYLNYTRNLGFKERPDYNMLRKLYRDVRLQVQKEENQPVEDHAFEWNDGKDLGQLVPLNLTGNVPQPDDHEVRSRSRGLCCLCGGKGQVDD